MINYLIVAMITLCVSCSQSHDYIKSNRHCDSKSVVLESSTLLENIWITDFVNFFHVSRNELFIADSLLIKQISILNHNKLGQDGSKLCPFIDKNINNYYKQYVCFVNSNNNKIVFINFIHKRNITKYNDWNKKLILRIGGCSNYWNIKVDITNLKCYDLNINGIS